MSTPTASRSDARDRIVNATFALIVEEGLGGVTMTRIADRADVARQTLYNHFADVEQIVVAGIEEYNQTGFAHLVDLLEASESPETKLDLKASYKAGDKEVRWQPVRSRERRVDIPRALGIRPVTRPMVAYTLVYAHAADDVDAELEVWYRHGMSIWVNGRKVLDSSRVNLWHVQFDRVPVKLRKGVNPILLKVGSYPWGWYFAFRLRAPRAALAEVRLRAAPALGAPPKP